MVDNDYGYATLSADKVIISTHNESRNFKD